jgi:hypothetical protein
MPQFQLHILREFSRGPTLVALPDIHRAHVE